MQRDNKPSAGTKESRPKEKSTEGEAKKFSPDESLKLIDFGFARVCEEKDVLQLPCGTLHYASPDVLRRSYNAKCDLWSTGVIAFMLLTGSPPFVGQTNQTIIERIRAGEIRLNSRY